MKLKEVEGLLGWKLDHVVRDLDKSLAFKTVFGLSAKLVVERDKRTYVLVGEDMLVVRLNLRVVKS